MPGRNARARMHIPLLLSSTGMIRESQKVRVKIEEYNLRKDQ